MSQFFHTGRLSVLPQRFCLAVWALLGFEGKSYTGISMALSVVACTTMRSTILVIGILSTLFFFTLGKM